MTSLSALFAPKSVAVIGASQDTNKIRGRLLKLIIDGGFAGAIHPVNPSSERIQGLKAWASVRDIPGGADLALIAVPAPQVMDVLEECALAGVKAAAIYTAGPNGVPVGKRLQDHVARFAARTGMRILGPNAEGFIDTATGLIATFSPTLQSCPPIGPDALPGRARVSIVSQSGALAYALYSRLIHDCVPVRHLVSTGNEADIELLEAVDHLVAAGGSRAILLFVEGFREPARFAAVAEHAAAAGVLLVVAKVGRSSAGQRAAVSHTAHLTGADTAYEAAFRRHGVIRVDDPSQMLAVAAAVSAGFRPRGPRVAIITTSGGAGGWAADLCEAANLEVPPLDAGFKQQLAGIVPDYGSVENPVDVTARVVEDGGSTLMGIVSNLGRAPGVDMGLIIMTMTAAERMRGLEKPLTEVLAATDLPVMFHSPGQPAPSSIEALARAGSAHMSLEGFAFAMRALDEHRRFMVRRTARQAAAPVTMAGALPLPAVSGTLSAAQARALLEAHGVRMPVETLAHSADEARAAAERMGYPVALKIASADIAHKTEAGGVALELANGAEVAAAHARILDSVRRHAPQARVDGVQVQKMMPPGRELVVGVVRDPDFGPLVMLGRGGIFVEVLRDVVFAPAPLDTVDAHDMIGRLKGRAILEGARGEPPADVDALAQLLVDVSRLAAGHADRIAEIDLNPVLLYPAGQGAVAVDALVVLADAGAAPAH